MRFSHGIMGNPLCGAAFKQTLHSFAFCSQVLVCDGSARLWCGRDNDGEAHAWQKHRQKNTNHTDWFTAVHCTVLSQSPAAHNSQIMLMQQTDYIDHVRENSGLSPVASRHPQTTDMLHLYVSYILYQPLWGDVVHVTCIRGSFSSGVVVVWAVMASNQQAAVPRPIDNQQSGYLPSKHDIFLTLSVVLGPKPE